MKHLPTWEERQQLAQKRASRQAQLLEQAAALRQQIAAQSQACAQIAADEPRTPPTERIATQIERLSAAQIALDLAARLLQTDDPDSQPISEGVAQPSARELHTTLGERLGQWYRAGAGWWEVRTVWRPRIEISRDPDTHEIEVSAVWWPYGPYFYRHWRQEGKQHTQYLGTERPDDYPEDTTLTLFEPQPISDLGPLTQQARSLAQRLHNALEHSSGKQQRRRLRRALRRAMQRGLRRLQAETHQPPTASADEQAQAPSQSPLQSVLLGASTKAHLTLDNLTTLCGRRLELITTAAPNFVEHHDCQRCAQQARALGYKLP